MIFTDVSNQSMIDEARDKTQSQGGYVVCLCEADEKGIPKFPRYNILSWSSKKIRRTCRSSFAAEAIAASDAADIALYRKELLEEMRGREVPKAYLATDSLNVRDAVITLGNHTAEKRLRVDLYALKENMRNDGLGLLWIDGTQNISDSMTKPKGPSACPLTKAPLEEKLPFDTLMA